MSVWCGMYCDHHCLNYQGVGPDVPRHLRATGQVRNRRIGKGVANRLINGFWQYRVSVPDGSSQPVSCLCTLRYVLSQTNYFIQNSLMNAFSAIWRLLIMVMRPWHQRRPTIWRMHA